MMERCIYARYNRERLPRFQTATLILQTDKDVRVKKMALTPVATAHIQEMKRNHAILQESFHGVRMLAETEDSLSFAFHSGTSLDEWLARQLQQGNSQGVLRRLASYRQWIEERAVTMSSPRPPHWHESAAYTERLCLPQANIDLTFDNIFLDEPDGFTVIDSEWMFADIPVEFIFCRAISRFYDKYQKLCESVQLTLADLLTAFGIPLTELVSWQQMEQAFQSYVYGADPTEKIPPGYCQPVVALATLQHKATVAAEMATLISRAELMADAKPEPLRQQPSYEGVLQLFASEDDNGFAEHKSVVLPKKGASGCYRFELEWLPQARRLRLDPLDGSCVIRLEEATLVLQSGERIPLGNASTNADWTDRDIYYFSDRDPQLCFDLDIIERSEPIQALEVSLSYLDLIREGHLHLQRQKAAEEYLTAALRRTEEELRRTEEELRRILHSRTWKLASAGKKAFQWVSGKADKG